MQNSGAMHEEPHWRLSSRELVLIFVFWTSLALLSSVNRMLDPRGFGFRMSPGAPILMAFIEAWVWAAVTPVVFWLTSRFSTGRSPLAVRVLILIALGLVLSMLVWIVLTWARQEIFETALRRRQVFSPLRDIARFRFVNQLLFYCAILAAGFAREYFLRDRDRAAQAATLQAQLAEARLHALRMQINPHFLFNTLHAISALVERDPAGVRKMIARLSELLRHTTDSSAADEIPLRDEIDFLRRYIEIMEVRFQGRLRVAMNIDPSALDGRVPSLILQPIVENALEHGASRSATGEVEIAARRQNERLVLSVRDNGPGLAEGSREGIGVSNTRARLAQLYGDRASLVFRADNGTVAEISLPWR